MDLKLRLPLVLVITCRHTLIHTQSALGSGRRALAVGAALDSEVVVAGLGVVEAVEVAVQAEAVAGERTDLKACPLQLHWLRMLNCLLVLEVGDD